MRGRPKLTMTRRRKQVLDLLIEFARNDEGMTLGQLVRRGGFYDNRTAKRMLADLRKMGQID